LSSSILKKSHISKMSSTMKAACAITPIILIAAVGFIFPRVWFWISWEIFGSVLVAVGCIGEWVLLYTKEGAEHNRRERKFAIVVAIGVTMDAIGLGHAIPEAIRIEGNVTTATEQAEKAHREAESNAVVAAQANERAGNAEKEAQKFRLKADELEKQIQPREINPSQAQSILNRLQKLKTKKCRIIVSYNQPDVETSLFAFRLRELITGCGFDCSIESTAWIGSNMGPLPTGISVEAHRPTAPDADELISAFVSSGVFPPRSVTRRPDFPDSTLKISVWVKPLPDLNLQNAT
jgi:hypothetical protein